jgi:predicted RNA polymerase sigma factor
MRAELRRLIEPRIDRLPEAFRTVFVLRAVEELSVEEVATALELPEATVRTRFFRACSLLRESLSRETSRSATPSRSPVRIATASSPACWRGGSASRAPAPDAIHPRSPSCPSF